MMAKIVILLVDDNPADAELTKVSFEKVKVANELYWVEDGMEALRFLRQEGGYSGSPRPDLVLLDLNMPRMDGRELLAQMKADGSLKSIPVIILTSSEAEEDVLRSYQLQASAYVTKPVDLKGLAKIVRGIEGFWLAVVQFPANCS